MNHRPLSRCLLLALLCSTPAFGQTPEPLRLDGVGPAGTRSSVTESYASFKFIVHNLGPTPRDARVVIHYPEQEGVQYARDVWVPPMSSLTSWVPVGPAPPQSAEIGREIRMLLYDRTGGGMWTGLCVSLMLIGMVLVAVWSRRSTLLSLEQSGRVFEHRGG